MEPLLITPGQAAKLLGVHRTTVYRLLDSGQIPVVLLGSRRMIHKAKLIEQIDASATVNNDSGASGVVHGSETCRIKGPAHRTGGSLSPRREAASRLESLLAR